MEQEKKVNYAEIARVYNISYSMLYKKVHAGLSLEDAVAACEQARDARLISGQLRAPRSNLSPITFNGITYSSFAAACRAFGLSEQTGYMKRKRTMDKESIFKEEAALRVLQEAVEHPPRYRCSKKSVTVNGVTYQSQTQAAQILNLPMGSVSSKRYRKKLDAEETIEERASWEKTEALLTYDPPFLDQKWEDFKSSLEAHIPHAQKYGGILTASYQLPDGPSVSCEISMPNAQCLNFRFKDLDFISSKDVIGLSAAYCGIKFIFNEYGQVEALSDIFLNGHLKSSDIRLAQNAWRHCLSVLSIIYLSKRNL